MVSVGSQGSQGLILAYLELGERRELVLCRIQNQNREQNMEASPSFDQLWDLVSLSFVCLKKKT